MDFLTPLFGVAGLIAGTIPIVLHMLRRAPTQEMPFTLVRFLKPSQPRLTKRSSIEHWPLMLLRILALVLIGLAFARPFQREVIGPDAVDETVQSVTVLMDGSASMRRTGLREETLSALQDVVDDLGPQDLLHVVRFSQSPKVVLDRSAWQSADAGEREAMVQALKDSYEPDWMNTATGLAVGMAADDLSQEQQTGTRIALRRLVLITDFQRGSQLEELQSGNWPADVRLDLKIVSPRTSGNVGVTYVADRRSDRTRLRITSAGDSQQRQVQLQPFDPSGAPVGSAVPITIAPGQRRSVLLPAADPQDARSIAGVELLNDDHPFDNVIDLPELENPIVKVAHVGAPTTNDPESMRYYAQRVFAGNVERDVKLVDLIADAGPPLPIPSDVQLLLATSAVPEALLDSVDELFRRGGTVLLAAPDAAAVRSLKKFLPAGFEVREADVDDYAMLGQIEFDHPLFAAFRDARFSDFSSIRFWKHRTLQFSEEDRQPDDWAIVARFDNGSPAIAEVTVGDSGRLVLLASGWHPTDSQLALSTRFPALLTRILSLASPPQRQQLIRNVGDFIRPNELIGTQDWTLVLPDRSTLTADDLPESVANPDADDTSDRSLQLTEPGRYAITGTVDNEPRSVSLIAGLDPAETRTETLPTGQLQILGVNTSESTTSTDETDDNEEVALGQLSRNELEKRQQLWRWLLLAGLSLLAIETLWAAAIQRRREHQPASV
jgi:hypothetical protein